MFRRLLLLIALVTIAACTPLANPTTLAPTPTSEPLSTATPVKPPTATAIPTLPPTITPTPVSFAEGVIVGLWDTSMDNHSLGVVDPNTGLSLPNYPTIKLGANYWASFTPDKRTLAIMAYPSHESGLNGRLHLIDVERWQDTPTDIMATNWLSARVFSADGQYFAFAYNRSRTNFLVVVDMTTLTPVTHTLAFAPTHMAFAPDNTTLMLYGTTSNTIDYFNPEVMVALLQVSDGSVLWEQALAAVKDGSYVADGAADPYMEAISWRPVVGLDPSQSRGYILLAEHDQLLTIDYKAQKVASADLAKPQAWLDQLLAATADTAEAKELNGTFRYGLFSPDKTQLYVSTVKNTYQNRELLREPLGLMVIDLASASIVAEVQGVEATEMRWSPDYRYLLLNGDQAEILEVQTLESVKTLPGQFLTAGYNRQGAPLILALSPMQTRGRYWALEATSFSRIAEWPLRSFVEILDQP